MLGIYKQVVEELKEKIIHNLKDRINSLILYGSVVEGKARKESDIDILIIAKDNDKKIYNEISKIRTHIDLENKTLTSLVFLSRVEVEKYLKLGSPFLWQVLREGLVLYDDGVFKRIRESFLKKG